VFFGKAAVVDGGQSILQGFGRPGGMLSEEALCEGHVGRLSGVVTWNGEKAVLAGGRGCGGRRARLERIKKSRQVDHQGLNNHKLPPSSRPEL